MPTAQSFVKEIQLSYAFLETHSCEYNTIQNSSYGYWSEFQVAIRTEWTKVCN